MHHGIDILAIGVHPDDIELSCSGTLLRHIDLGYSVGLLDLTRGELGSRGTDQTRASEAARATELMGARFRTNVGIPDGLFDINAENKLKVVRMIRKFRPRIVLANAITDRHPDHGRAATLVSDACYLSGLLKIETAINGQKQDHWRPDQVYHYIQDRHISPDFVVNIDKYMEKKMALIRCFETQFYKPGDEGPVTPISTQSFMEFIKAKARFYGRHINAEFGEGFTKASYIGVRDLFDLL